MDQTNPFRFQVDFWGNEVLINQRLRLRTNELLTDLLCDEPNFVDAQDMIAALMNTFLAAFPEEDSAKYTQTYIDAFDEQVRAFAQAVETVDQYRLTLPPYRQLYPKAQPLNRVFAVLDSYPQIWSQEYNEQYDWMVGRYPSEPMGEYTPYCLKHPEQYPEFASEEGSPLQSPIAEFHSLMGKLEELREDCLSFVIDSINAPGNYKILLEEYIHIKNHFLTASELAASLERFDRDHKKDRLGGLFHAEHIGCSMRIISDDGTPALSERYTFQNTADFLYVDFLRGLKSNYLPKRCSNCGRWFLQTGGKYLEYCSRPLEGDASKTCRDVGAQMSYALKCKNDPVWETYLRAYKTHFARQRKGKMTPDEFRIWADNAILWRGQAERGELDFDAYCSMIRK